MTCEVEFSLDYFIDNFDYMRCLDNWNRYLSSDEQNEDILAEWKETLLNDFLQGARKYLVDNYFTWGAGLE